MSSSSEHEKCDHTEFEFSRCEVDGGDLIFHVNCCACGRSGSVIITSEDVHLVLASFVTRGMSSSDVLW